MRRQNSTKVHERQGMQNPTRDEKNITGENRSHRNNRLCNHEACNTGLRETTHARFTIFSLINDQRGLIRVLALECKKSSTSSTTAENLAKASTDMVETRDLQGRVVALTTDCEPSVAKAGRSGRGGWPCRGP